MKTLADRLNEKMKEMDISQEKLALEVGVSQTTISKISKGETLRSKFMPKIAEALGVTESWLMFGDVTTGSTAFYEIARQHALNGKEAVTKIFDENSENLDGTYIPGFDHPRNRLTINEILLREQKVAVPFFNGMALSAGLGALNSQCVHDGEEIWVSKSFLKDKGTLPDKVFCISVKGDSMEPRYDAGGVVMIDTMPNEILDGKAYAIHYQDQDYIKYLRRLPDNKLLISSENSEFYSPFEAKIEDVKIIGRVISYQRDE